MTTLDLLLSRRLGDRLFLVEDRLLVTRYRQAMTQLGIPATELDSFRIDAAGWSPEVAVELEDPCYLGHGPSHPSFVVLTVDQLGVPLLQPNAGFGARPFLDWASAHRRELADLTLREAVVGAFTHGMTRFRRPSQLGLVRKLRLELETPEGRLGKAHELGALRAALLAEGEAWRDEEHLARMRELAAATRGWASLPEGMTPGREVPVGPAFLAEYGGCHLLPSTSDEGPVAWLLVPPELEHDATGDDAVAVIPALVETVDHFLVARGLVDPSPSTDEVDRGLLEELREWLASAEARPTCAQEVAAEADLASVEELLLHCQGRPRFLDLGGCSPATRLRVRPLRTRDPDLRWWTEHLRASVDPFLGDRLGMSPAGERRGIFPHSNSNPVTREEVAV